MRVIPTSVAALLNQPLDDGRTDRPWTLNGCDNDDDEIRKKNTMMMMMMTWWCFFSTPPASIKIEMLFQLYCDW